MSGKSELTRIRRERKTIRAMIQLYCHDQHTTHSSHTDALCPSCAALEAYAMQRLDGCPYSPDKPTCVHCPTHCYKPDMREQVRVVMRYAGPRMLTRHPLLSMMHLIDGKLDRRRILRRGASRRRPNQG